MPTTFVVGTHGVLRLHPWVLRRQERGTFEFDTYSLMLTRSSALGLVELPPEENELARWHQEEAGEDWTQDGATRQVAWMQAGAANLNKQRIPVWTALTCLQDSMAKIGSLEIAGTHAVLPLHADAPAASQLPNAVDWFSLEDSVPRHHFTISLYTATCSEEAFDSAALTETFRSLTSSLLSTETIADRPEGTPEPGSLEGCWLLGNDLTELHLRCQSTEWSADMAAFTTDAIAQAAHATGLRRYVLISVFKRNT
ncbi:hypothetical protein ACL03H_07515 [Saccharopolyspora sp. MS10]|uniref:hypothetical protein n=1 Tax=Saccharopolyspora sp. MS10 TaxID=3385973 RepID=UPI00399FFDB3